MKFVPFTDENFVFTGVWQENGAGEIVSYKSAAFVEIGFTGATVRLDAKLEYVAQFYIDGKEVHPSPNQAGFTFTTDEGEHLLKIGIRINHHMYFKGIYIDDEANTFKPPVRTYVHFIGDSITQAYPGYSTSCGERLGVDYSIVALGGMALSDGWGWYTIPEGLPERVGMESNYFKLEYPFESVSFTDYKFTYCRQPDVVTVFLGTNDFLDNQADFDNGHLEIFREKYSAFLSRLREIYPEPPIYVLQALSDKMFRRQGIKEAFELAAKNDKKLHLIPTDGWGVEISVDGTHPSLAGYADMGEKLAEYLKKELSI